MASLNAPRITDTKIKHWRAFELLSTEHEDISNDIEWVINDDRHAIIVHRGGLMQTLETELDGKGMSYSPANAGEIWIAPAGSNYAAYASGDTVDYSVIFIKPEMLGEILPNTSSFSQIMPRHGHRDDFCFHCVQKLIEFGQQEDDVSQMFGESLSQSLFIYLYQQYGRESQETINLAPEHALSPRTTKWLQVYIDDHLSDKITLEALSVLAGMTTHHFLIAFRQVFNTTPAQYIITQRLRRAQWLLTNSKQDITTIAHATGFSSHSHLATTFKKHIGYSPREFRKSWQS